MRGRSARPRRARSAYGRRLGWAALSAGAAGAAAAALYGWGSERLALRLERVAVPVAGLDPALAGLRLALLSDLHLERHTPAAFVRTAVAGINALQPDLIAIAGDLVSRGSPRRLDLAELLRPLRARHGVWAVLGNHDLEYGAREVAAAVASAGHRLLCNQGEVLEIAGSRLAVAGVDDALQGRPDLRRALARVPSHVPTVLLAHEPDTADAHLEDERVALQLSGHSHGGQVRLPGLGPLLLPPGCRKYPQGLYRIRGRWLYTSRGLGTVGLPLRLACPPEITELTLRPA